MAFESVSPNMLLTIPGVGLTLGPQWATDINSCLTIIDQHDHTQGSGVLITPEAIDINKTLTFNNQLAANVQALNLVTQQTDAGPMSLYVKLGGESPPGPYADLWYNDGSNPPIQITSAGIVNTIAASIPGESYSAGTFVWKQTQSSLPTTPANFDIGSITLRPNTAATTNGITLSLPTPITSLYTLILPALPPVQSFMTLDNSGNITAPWVVDNSTIVVQSNVIKVPAGGITSTQIANNTIIGSNIANGTITSTQISTSVNGFSLNSGTQIFNTPGSHSWTVPTGVTKATVSGVGGGGGGGGCTAQGGGAGSAGGTGGSTTFDGVVISSGGAGGGAGIVVSPGIASPNLNSAQFLFGGAGGALNATGNNGQSNTTTESGGLGAVGHGGLGSFSGGGGGGAAGIGGAGGNGGIGSATAAPGGPGQSGVGFGSGGGGAGGGAGSNTTGIAGGGGGGAPILQSSIFTGLSGIITVIVGAGGIAGAGGTGGSTGASGGAGGGGWIRIDY